MPTDMLQAMQKRRAGERRERRRDIGVLLLIAVAGSAATIVRALQSDAFGAALIALGTLE